MNAREFFGNLWHFILLFRPFSKSEKEALEAVLPDLPKDARTKAKKLVKQYCARIARKQMPYSEKITAIRHRFALEAYGEESKDEIARLNTLLGNAEQSRISEEFSKNAWQNMQAILAPGLIGFEGVKKGVALAVFSKEPVHILLIGDTGTGKTDILRAVEEIAPVSAFGLGSGTSNTGLTVTVRGKEVKKGLLALADSGIALIDELNLMKPEDRAGLYNAMEKGFIAFDKGGYHYKFDARCSVLASANPKGGKFRGNSIHEISEQMPFEPALLSRFHLTYIVREHTMAQFMKIADSVLSHENHEHDTEQEYGKNDAEFLKKYIEKTKSIDVDFRKEEFSRPITDFVRKTKESEGRLAINITPRFVVGLMRLIEASARLELRGKVEKKDVLRAIDAVNCALGTVRF